MNTVIESTRWVIFSVFFSALMVACGGGGSGNDSINGVSSISITPSERSYNPGTQQQLTAVVTREDNTTQTFTEQVTWRSSNTDVATVDGGLFRALIAGNVNITVTVDGVSRTQAFTVADQIESVELRRGGVPVTTAAFTLAANSNDQLQAFARRSSGAEQNVTNQSVWSSADTSRVTVNQTGRVTGVTRTTNPVAVTARLTVDGQTLVSNQARYTVTAELQSIRVAPANASVPAGLTQQFTAFGTFSDGGESQLSGTRWSVTANPPGSVTINAQSGVATGVSENGIGTIIATNDGISSDDSNENGRLTVDAPLVNSIEVQPSTGAGTSNSNPQLPVNNDDQFTATATFSDGSSGDVTDRADWSSADSNTAVVNNDSNKGLVTGIAQGTTSITATITNPDGSTPSSATDSIDIDVTDEAPSSIQITIAPGDSFNRVAIGFELQFVAIGTFADGSTQDVSDQVTWRLSVPSTIAVIDNNNRPGRLTAVNVSDMNTVEDVTVTATVDSNSVGSAIDITVEDVNLDSITVGPENSGATGGLPVGEDRQYQATGNFVTGVGPTAMNAFSMALSDQVTWTIRSPNAPNNEVANATVNNTGNVVGVSAGDVQVRAACSRNTPPAGQGPCTDAFGNRINGNTPLTITDAVVTDLLIADVAFGTGCSLSPDEQNDDEHLKVDLANGRSTQLFACAQFSDNTSDTGYADSPNITWNEVNCSVGDCDNFTVSNNAMTKGQLTAMAVGTGSVTATVAANGSQPAVNSEEPIAVTVSEKVLDAICVEPAVAGRDCSVRPADSDISAPAGVRTRYRARGIFSAGDPEILPNSEVSWSADPAMGVVSITAAGVVRGLAEGVGQTAQIIATSGNISSADGSGAAYTVTAATLSSVAVTPSPVSQASQTSRALTATATFSDGSMSNVTTSSNTVWSSSNEAAVIVSNGSGNKGEIFARGAAGTAATITATYTFSGDTQAGTTDVTVAQGQVTAITVTPANASIAVNGSQQYTATARRSDGSTEDVSGSVAWSIVTTGDGGAATITNTGNATGTSAGTVRVFARFTRPDNQTVSGNTRLTITSSPAP